MNNKSSRVLIVDDMQINRIVLSSLLATKGIVSDQADGGAECLRLCEKNDYDLILLDHRMPEPDGVQTLVKLKELFTKRQREIPVICHTTEEGRQNIPLYKAAGFADVLIKPIEPREFFDVIMTYLTDDAAFSDPHYTPRSDIAVNGDDSMEEIEKLPLWLKLVPHIDLVAGIKSCGGAEDYIDALYIFYSSIAERSDELETFLENGDWTMYALRVHSLKSMARLIGAKKLGETAAVLETAAREGSYELIRRETPSFIRSYREFNSLLSHFSGDELPRAAKKQPQTPDNDDRDGSDTLSCSHSILYVQSGESIIKKGIEKNLTQAGFSVISVPDEPDRIIAHRSEADIVIYNPAGSEISNIGITMSLLGEICQDDAKVLCLTGDYADISSAMLSNGSHRVSREYPRPISMDTLINDMKFFSMLEKDYHRKKTIFVVDDDPGYLSVIGHWLSPVYNVSCFLSGSEVLAGLSALTPDLMLLDIEMPEMDGCELMKRIRISHPEQRIPIIFLTGKNDRDIVFHVLEYKPDGYLLKTSQKDSILDVLHRFFAESLFRMTQ